MRVTPQEQEQIERQLLVVHQIIVETIVLRHLGELWVLTKTDHTVPVEVRGLHHVTTDLQEALKAIEVQRQEAPLTEVGHLLPVTVVILIEVLVELAIVPLHEVRLQEALKAIEVQLPVQAAIGHLVAPVGLQVTVQDEAVVQADLLVAPLDQALQVAEEINVSNHYNLYTLII